LFAEVDRVELGKLSPLADRFVAETYGFVRELIENHEQLAVCLAWGRSAHRDRP
jgi:hypothetical protein